MTPDRRGVQPGVQSGVLAAALGVAAVAGGAFAVSVACSGASRSAVPETAAPKRPSLHAAPAGDAAALNADVERRLPPALAKEVLAEGRPAVVIFLKADCECSRGFATTVTALAPHLQRRVACTAFIEGTIAEADTFAATTRLAIPFIAQPDSELAQAWGVRKAGCFALVAPDGSVEAVWPGVSRQGFRDLAGRLGLTPPLPENLLADVPGAATAGCPLDFRGSGLSSAPPLLDHTTNPRTETTR
jgi:hypothetical protein